MNVSTHRSSHILLLGMSHPNYSFEVPQITSPNILNDGDSSTTTITSSVPTSTFETTMNGVVKNIFNMIKNKEFTQMDGRDLYRIIALELMYNCRCHTVSVVSRENPTDKFNKLYHNCIDYCSRTFVTELETKYASTIKSFDEIYFDYYWMIHSADKFTKNLWKENIPLMMTKLLKEDGKMYLPFSARTVEWIATYIETYDSVMDISFISKGDIHQHKLCFCTHQLNERIMQTIFSKDLHQEENNNICHLKLCNVKKMDVNPETTVGNIEQFLLKYVGNETTISDTRFIVLSNKKKKPTVDASKSQKQSSIESTQNKDSYKKVETDTTLTTTTVQPSHKRKQPTVDTSKSQNQLSIESTQTKDRNKKVVTDTTLTTITVQPSRKHSKTSVKAKVMNDQNTIVLPRVRNKKHDSSQTDFTLKQTNYFASVILDKKHVNKYIQLKNTKHQNKVVAKDFLRNLIVQHITEKNIVVKRYDEKLMTYNDLSDEDLWEYIKSSFTSKLNRFKQKNTKQVKKLTDVVTINSTTNTGNEKKNNCNTTYTVPSRNHVPNILPQRQQMYNYEQCYSIYNNLKVNSNSMTNTSNDEFPHYSMIHNFFEPFQLIVYSYSHRVSFNGENDTVHYCTRTTIEFPENMNVFILFHGFLVHSGAKARKESTNMFTLNYAKDARSFSYVDRFGNEKRKHDGISTHDNEITTTSRTNLCPMFDNKECRHCNEVYGTTKDKYIDNDDCKINVQDIYNKLDRKQQGKPICGNLINTGWAIYHSIDMRNSNNGMNYCNEIQRELHEMTYSRGMSGKWKEIQKKRYQLKIDNSLDTNRYRKHFEKTSEYLENVFNEKVKNCVHGFENASLQSKSILMNTGPAEEQKAHSDYGMRGGL